MKSALLALSAASSVAAQAMTFPAGVDIVAAINPADPEYTACSAAEELVSYCVDSVGGNAATADPTALLSCACCADGTPISPVFSVCSTYIEAEAPQYETEASAFGDLYTLCDLNIDCKTGGGSRPSVPRTSESLPTDLTTPEPLPTQTSTPDETASITGTAEQTYATACEDMIGIFTSCTNKISDFTDLPYREQASCYCCRTGRNGDATWTDALDEFASSCASWARTGEPETAYSVARTFATFCENFSDVCDGATQTANSVPTTTSGSSNGGSGGSGGNGGSGSSGGNGNNGGGVTVTVTPTPTPGSAAGLRVGCGAVAAVVGAVALVL